jgi:Cdc6-like AAA superfamily ATPase
MADNAILIGKAVTSPDSLPETHGQVFLQGRLGNRHGLVAGATGTGKTVTLMTIAEGSRAWGCRCSSPM